MRLGFIILTAITYSLSLLICMIAIDEAREGNGICVSQHIESYNARHVAPVTISGFALLSVCIIAHDRTSLAFEIIGSIMCIWIISYDLEWLRLLINLDKCQ